MTMLHDSAPYYPALFYAIGARLYYYDGVADEVSETTTDALDECIDAADED